MSSGDDWATASCSVRAKDTERAELQKKMAAFEAAGGMIVQVDSSANAGLKNPMMRASQASNAIRGSALPTAKQKQIIRIAMQVAEDGIFNRKDLYAHLSENDRGNLQTNIRSLIRKGYFEKTDTKNHYKIIKEISTND